jgi:DNA-binding NtrC family response regulator
MERAVIMGTGDTIQVEDLAVDIQTMSPDATGDLHAASEVEPDPRWLDHSWVEVRKQVLEEAELRYLRGLLEATRGRVGDTASRAGMDPRSLREKMKKYGLRKEDFRGA